MRTFHRVAGAILALQLLAWILTGMLFNVKYGYDEAYEQLTTPVAQLNAAGTWVSPADAIAAAGVEPASVQRVHLVATNRGYQYLLDGAGEQPTQLLVDARTGGVIEPLDAAGAEAAMRAALQKSPHSARYGAVKTALAAPVPSTLLGRSAPGWELTLDTGQTVTVGAYTAEISHTGLLNTAIDWTYRIHYMQYTPWPQVNIAVIIVFSVVTGALVFSGVMILTEGRRRRRRYGYGTRKLKF